MKLYEADAGSFDHSLSYNFEILLISLGKSKLIQKNPVLCCCDKTLVVCCKYALSLLGLTMWQEKGPCGPWRKEETKALHVTVKSSL